MPLVELHLQELQVVHLQELVTQVELQLAPGYPKCVNDILIFLKEINQPRQYHVSLKTTDTMVNLHPNSRNSKPIEKSVKKLTFKIYILYTNIQQLFQGC